MNKKISILVVAIVVGAFGAASLLLPSEEASRSSTTTVVDTVKGALQNYSVEELAKGTPYVIIGTVQQITPVLIETEIGEKVFSNVLITVEEDLNGDYSENEITVRILGGEIETRKTISHFSPTFEENERVLFFVSNKEPESIYGDNYYVAGLSMGKYSIENDSATNDATKESTGLNDLVSQIQRAK